LQFTDDKVTFETGKKELTCGTKENLARIVGYLSRDIAGIEKITIIGHTDFTGSPQFNEGLAIARANEVREYLQASGIPGEMLAEPEGHSFRRPFGYATDQSDEVIRHSNETAAQKAKNRRVQMNVLNLKAP
jgi:outer membrane protein OmpA-like peptidoglycan-associated protein